MASASTASVFPRFRDCSEWLVRQAAPQHRARGANVRIGPPVTGFVYTWTIAEPHQMAVVRPLVARRVET